MSRAILLIALTAVVTLTALLPPRASSADQSLQETVARRLGQAQPTVTATPRPAPSEDRVGFPEGYQSDYTVYFALDRPDNKQVRVIYANERAASAKAGEAYPYGSVFVMETWTTKKDEAGNVLLDAQGRYQRDQLTTIFVQRKEPGFGAEYEQWRSGEWEYVAYRPDRSYQTTPRNTNACAACHLQQAGAAKDYIFRANLFFARSSGAVPKGIMQNYTYIPDTITVRIGSTVSWYNDDDVFHTVSAEDGSFDSGTLTQSASFGWTFSAPGSYGYACAFHPTMKARVVVEE